MHIGESIYKYRSEKNITQEELAGKLHVTRQAVSSWETGKSIPDIELIKRIALALDVKVNDLIGSYVGKTNRSALILKIWSVLSLVIIIVFIMLFHFDFDGIKLREYSGSCPVSTPEYEITAKQYKEDGIYGYTMDYTLNHNISIASDGKVFCIPYSLFLTKNQNELLVNLEDYVTFEFPNEFDYIVEDLNIIWSDKLLIDFSLRLFANGKEYEISKYYVLDDIYTKYTLNGGIYQVVPSKGYDLYIGQQ